MEVFQEFIASPAGIAAKAMLGLAFLDFLLGVIAAFRDGTFDVTAVAAFVRKHILGRVAPITALLAGGYFINDAAILSGAIAASGVYVMETAGSLLESIGQIREPEGKAFSDDVPFD